MPRQHYGRGERINLAKDFPQIEDITGVVEIKPSFGGLQKEVRPFTKSNLPAGYIHCNNPVCNNGGVPLEEVFWDLLSQMVRNKQVGGEVGEFCQGYENMGSHQRRDCRTTYVYLKIQIKYRDSETKKIE